MSHKKKRRRYTEELAAVGRKWGQRIASPRKMINPQGTHLKKRRWVDGRSKCTAGRRRAITIAVKNGLTPIKAARLAGVEAQLLNQWLQKGRDGVNQLYADFYRQIALLLAQKEREALDVIRAVMKGEGKIKETKIVLGRDGTEVTRIIKESPMNWHAAAWRLERMDPDLYGKRTPAQDLNVHMNPAEIAVDIRNALAEMEASIGQEDE